MTSRLEELRGGLPHVDSVVSNAGADDVEGGLDPESERLMTRFNKEADAIRNVLEWSRGTVADVDRSFAVGQSSASPDRLAEAGAKLDQVEDKLAAVRKRLKRIAGENKDFKRDHGNRTAVVRTRIIQYKQMGQRFIDVTKELERVRGKHRDALSRSVQQDVMRANPGMTPREADDAMAAGDRGLDSVMYADRADTTELRYQVEDIKNRNAEIHKLTRNMAELNTMFVDMSILVEGQQELLNNIEYNVEEVQETTKAAAEELVGARKYQKAKNRKKCWCMIICLLIVVAAAAAVIIPLGNKLGWFNFGGGGSNKNTGNNIPRRTAATATDAGVFAVGGAATAVGKAVDTVGGDADVVLAPLRNLDAVDVRRFVEIGRRMKSLSLQQGKEQ
jgi:t-SNARE complex subunit (syntaxin)